MTNVDRYTRIVLTVIAACLVWLCARDARLVSEAHAQDGDVVECRIEGSVTVEAVSPLPVEVAGGVVNVRASAPLPVEVENRVHNPIPVFSEQRNY